MYMSMPLHSRVQYRCIIQRKGSCVAKINNNYRAHSANIAANY